MREKPLKVDFLMVRKSQYEVLHYFTYKLFEAAKRAGLNCRLLHGDDIITVSQEDPPDLSVGFNGVPRNKDNQMICDLIRRPYLSLLVDPPYRFLYVTGSPYTMITCDDRFCCTLLNSLEFTRNFFLPHAVEPELSPDSQQEKIFDVVMLATFIDFKHLRESWKTKFHPVVRQVLEETAEYTFSEPTVSFIAAFNGILDIALQKHPHTLFEKSVINEALQDLELYIKGRDRYLLATAVKDVPLHIFGAAGETLTWKDYLGKNHPNIFPHAPVQYPQALNILKQAKILLNPNLKNKDGAHERIFAGIACGAAVITNQSAYISETLENGKDLLFYDHTDLNKVNTMVNDLLENESTREKLSANGRKKVMQHHTWDHRLEEILRQVPLWLNRMI